MTSERAERLGSHLGHLVPPRQADRLHKDAESIAKLRDVAGQAHALILCEQRRDPLFPWRLQLLPTLPASDDLERLVVCLNCETILDF